MVADIRKQAMYCVSVWILHSFVHKIYISAVSIACFCLIYNVSGHHKSPDTERHIWSLRLRTLSGWILYSHPITKDNNEIKLCVLHDQFDEESVYDEGEVGPLPSKGCSWVGLGQEVPILSAFTSLIHLVIGPRRKYKTHRVEI